MTARLRELVARVRDFFQRDRLSAELDDEIAFHRAMMARDRTAGDEPRDEGVGRRFGNTTQIREDARAVWGFAWLDALLQDARYAARSFARTPAFTVVAVATLALGIGANSAVFAVVRGVLLRPLPFPEPERLYLASYQPPEIAPRMQISMVGNDFIELARATRTFSDLTTFALGQSTLTGVGDPVRLNTAQVSAGFFDVLGVQPAIGRAFDASERDATGPKVAILAHALWRERFGGDSGIVGRTVLIGGVSTTVVGVMPAGFAFPPDQSVWMPMDTRIRPGMQMRRPVIGRLQRGATAQDAQAEIASLAPKFVPDPTQTEAASVARVFPLERLLVRNAKQLILVFAGAVLLVLVIAIANVGNLLVIRASGRRHELALRTALGAGRRRLFRQLLAENAVLVGAGAAIAVPLAYGGTRALLAFAPAGTIPRGESVAVDGGVLAFTLATAFVVCTVLSIVTAVSQRSATSMALAAHQTRVTRARRATTAFVVAGEMALALVLLAGTGLMIRTFAGLRAVDLGFDTSRVSAMTIALSPRQVGTAAELHAFHHDMLGRLARVAPGGTAAMVNWRPLGLFQISGTFRAEGHDGSPGFMVSKPAVSADYFRVMRIRMLAGRDFTERDDAGAPPVAIISSAVASRLWPGENAVGKRVSMSDKPTAADWISVVGVVDDIHQLEVRGSTVPAIYQPYQQVTQPLFLAQMTYLVRSSADAGQLLPALRAVLRDVDRDLAPMSLATMDDLVAETRQEPLFQARLLAVFALLALTLAAIGVYGVLAYSVAQRTREIGIRMALGARGGSVVGMVMRQTLFLAGAGLALGIGGAIAGTRVLNRFLFSVTPTDPMTLAGVSLLLAVVALAAGAIPARRASRIDPLVSLRRDGD